jgi:hypothetical protein
VQGPLNVNLFLNFFSEISKKKANYRYFPDNLPCQSIFFYYIDAIYVGSITTLFPMIWTLTYLPGIIPVAPAISGGIRTSGLPLSSPTFRISGCAIWQAQFASINTDKYLLKDTCCSLASFASLSRTLPGICADTVTTLSIAFASHYNGL